MHDRSPTDVCSLVFSKLTNKDASCYLKANVFDRPVLRDRLVRLNDCYFYGIKAFSKLQIISDHYSWMTILLLLPKALFELFLEEIKTRDLNTEVLRVESTRFFYHHPEIIIFSNSFGKDFLTDASIVNVIALLSDLKVEHLRQLASTKLAVYEGALFGNLLEYVNQVCRLLYRDYDHTYIKGLIGHIVNFRDHGDFLDFVNSRRPLNVFNLQCKLKQLVGAYTTHTQQQEDRKFLGLGYAASGIFDEFDDPSEVSYGDSIYQPGGCTFFAAASPPTSFAATPEPSLESLII